MKDCKSKNCKHYKKDERIGIIVCEYGLHESYCEKDKEDFAVDVLEKIKEEIKEEQKRILTLDNGQYYVALCDFQKLLDNHIAELKGE